MPDHLDAAGVEAPAFEEVCPQPPELDADLVQLASPLLEGLLDRGGKRGGGQVGVDGHQERRVRGVGAQQAQFPQPADRRVELFLGHFQLG